MTFYDDTYGALFVGLVISAALWGVTNLHTVKYFRSYPYDGILRKLGVIELWLLDTCHTALVAHGLFYSLVTNRGEIQLDIVWSLTLQIAIGCLVIISVQSLYIIQIWQICGVLSNNTRGVQLVLIFLLVLTYAATTSCRYTVHVISQISQVNWVIYMSTGIAICVDLMISLILSLSLLSRRSRFHATNSIIRTVAVASLRNGLLTIAGAVLEMFTLALLPNTMAVFTVNIVVVKVYVNSYLALLNARQRSPGSEYPTPAANVFTSRGTSSSFWSPGTIGGYSRHLQSARAHYLGSEGEVRFEMDDEVPRAI
ncbi:hypothetical protein OE88DRAFT_866256 [Heliocybe sulcata]|uniref:DUF6534 domain-containing protein n=1 Tax=Heliocybe sulcata TaxID=5364 RepID=A0A5C3MPW9_9AGAM|nr:hypothetical protein OE88DRAFT_866256 [Heliocybe sulcata]